MVAYYWWKLMALLTSCALGCYCARILAIFPDPSKSHVIAYEPLTKELAARGHHVTVICSHPQKLRIENYTDIAIPLEWFGTDSYHKSLLNKGFPEDNTLNHSGVSRCRHFLGNVRVQHLIHDDNHHFDLIIMEIDLHQCFLGFAHKYNASIIGIYGHSGTHVVHDIMGNTSPASYVPNIFHFFSDRMSLVERMQNFNSVHDARLGADYNNRILGDVMREYFKELEPLPSVSKLQERFAFLFFNNDVSLNFPRPLVPNIVDIAGMHIKPGGKLPKELQVLLDKARHGVIVFCMGSVLGNFLQSPDKIKEFADAFCKMRQLVIWKRKELIPGLASNIRVMNWLPLSEMLAHPNVQVFITHGGLLSLQEAVYNAVPIVGIPICADQFFNVQRAQDFGFGIRLEYANITSEQLQWALRTILTQESYRVNAKKASARFRDQIIPPLEKAVFWTEYALRHNGAKHLRSAALDLTWYQQLLLDVIASLALGAILLLLSLYLAYRFIRRRYYAKQVVLSKEYKMKSI